MERQRLVAVQSRLVEIGHADRQARGRIVQPKLAAPSMIEPLLCGIVLGLIPVTLAGLFVAAWNQYRRGSALGG
jgi:cytochrome b6-f complex subunit 5